MTLTSPATFPTRVAVTAAGSDAFESNSTAPFDKTVNHFGGYKFYYQAAATAHLNVSIRAEQIDSSLDGSVSCTAYMSAAAASLQAQFSFDIVVDTPTPFLFEATIPRRESWFAGETSGHYRLYTPDAGSLDILVGDGAPQSAFTIGILEAGVIYRLEFTHSYGVFYNGYLSGGGASGDTAATGRLTFNVPEPTLITFLLFAAPLILMRRVRRGPAPGRICAVGSLCVQK